MRYWEAILKDGTTVKEPENINEASALWRKIKPDVVNMNLIFDGITVSLPRGCKEYSQGKGASSGLNGGDFIVESRWISCVLDNNQTLKFRVLEGSKSVLSELS